MANQKKYIVGQFFERESLLKSMDNFQLTFCFHESTLLFTYDTDNLFAGLKFNGCKASSTSTMIC